VVRAPVGPALVAECGGARIEYVLAHDHSGRNVKNRVQKSGKENGMRRILAVVASVAVAVGFLVASARSSPSTATRSSRFGWLSASVSTSRVRGPLR
jgi:hypothetical protein